MQTPDPIRDVLEQLQIKLRDVTASVAVHTQALASLNREKLRLEEAIDALNLVTKRKS
jgi:hypothetical protein